MLLLRLALCIAAVACAFCAPLSVLREPNSASNDLDTFVSGLDSEDSGSVLLGSGFANGLSSLLRTGVDETVGAGLAGVGPPRLPATRVTLNFGISVDVGELPEASENGLPSSMSSSLLTGDASDRSFAPFSVGNVGAAVAEAGASASTTPVNAISLDG
ncbi:hypothetical protein BMF94_0782 [Rhodotorula taiwanensis]|uniref:Secreted protein n=1 Tax=Rhodotorula taiwanensis TaxID=741276 RepID=A0A2S5BH05_9BASI|nr:hypothetical protein BMF94_0782 [Rhodotorula taiwanensis]